MTFRFQCSNRAPKVLNFLASSILMLLSLPSHVIKWNSSPVFRWSERLPYFLLWKIQTNLSVIQIYKKHMQTRLVSNILLSVFSGWFIIPFMLPRVRITKCFHMSFRQPSKKKWNWPIKNEKTKIKQVALFVFVTITYWKAGTFPWWTSSGPKIFSPPCRCRCCCCSRCCCCGCCGWSRDSKPRPRRACH